MFSFLLLICLTFLNCVEDKFSARGIFVTVEYRGADVRGSVSYSFRFFNISDLIEIYRIPFYLIKDIKSFSPGKTLKLKIYGQSFYVFRYFNKKKEPISNLSQNTPSNSNEAEPDFFEYYSSILNKNIGFYIIDFALKSVSDEYTKTPKEKRKEFINDLNIFINKVPF